MQHSIAESYGTITFDNAFRGVDPLFEQALAYHALEAVHSTPQHVDRIAAAVLMCQQGSVQIRASVAMRRDGTMSYETAAARVKVHPDTLRADICTSEACTCGTSNGSAGWPCAHRYSVLLYQAASRTAEAAQYEQAQRDAA